MASKKASASDPVSAAMASASGPDVSGPVAMIQLPSSGSDVISSYETEMLGCDVKAGGIEVGPILMGMGNRVHIVTPSITVRGLINVSALAGTPVHTYA